MFWRLAGLVAAIIGLIGIWGVGTAVSDPLVVSYREEIAGLARPVRLVQLSDVHGGWEMPAWRIRRIVRQANALRPDLVVLTGVWRRAGGAERGCGDGVGRAAWSAGSGGGFGQ